MYTEQIKSLIDHMAADYRRFQVNAKCSPDYVEKSVQQFYDSVNIINGKTYIKLVIQGSARAFIVKSSDGKFRAGDILKVASFAAPAKNFARGNVLDGNFMNIKWTGA